MYIQEAHPVDGWQMASNVQENILFASTRTPEERSEVAGACVTDLGLTLPALVDGPDDAVDRAYMGWPDRLYVIDKDGKVAFKSAPGPFGFEPTGVRDALARLKAGRDALGVAQEAGT